MTTPTPTPATPAFVDTDFLRDHPHAVLADVRWYLDGRDGYAAFQSGHLPGAVWVDLDHQLAAADLPATEGRHPFPSPQAFADSMSALGIGNDSLVVAYDDTGGLTAGRLVVMLRMLGCQAAVLEGGLAAWSGEVQTGCGRTPEPARFVPVGWPADRLASTDDVAAVANQSTGSVIDARSPERFRGDVAQIDKRPGHIPGARCAPWSAVLGEDGTLRPTAELRARFDDLGVTAGNDTIAYCGSGVSACMNVLAIEHVGLGTARLYVASWSGWSADPNREAATGE
jgi:thiosulfate/3-mercaptopyruvate sulfurtransferase